MEGMREMLRGTLGRSLRAMPAFDRLEAAWPVSCGATMAQHGTLVDFSGGILRVSVTDPAWLQQMRSMAAVLTSDLGRIAGVPVAAIHFEIRHSIHSSEAKAR